MTSHFDETNGYQTILSDFQTLSESDRYDEWRRTANGSLSQCITVQSFKQSCRLEARVFRLEARVFRLDARVFRLEARVFRLEARVIRIEARDSMVSNPPHG